MLTFSVSIHLRRRTRPVSAALRHVELLLRSSHRLITSAEVDIVHLSGDTSSAAVIVAQAVVLVQVVLLVAVQVSVGVEVRCVLHGVLLIGHHHVVASQVGALEWHEADVRPEPAGRHRQPTRFTRLVIDVHTAHGADLVAIRVDHVRSRQSRRSFA